MVVAEIAKVSLRIQEHTARLFSVDLLCAATTLVVCKPAMRKFEELNCKDREKEHHSHV